ncbi:MAG: IgA Peptidase M64 [Marinifilaceae bacterium]|jgi:hypothetical protein|nr:IgA Peptidase M64 [Marinifilaceae bacterium]
MKKIVLKSILFCFLIWISPKIYAQNTNIKFDDFFENKTLRIDYYLSGNNKSEKVILQELKQEKHWSGNHNSLIDNFNYGNFSYELYDISTNKLIFSRGFNSLFEEWQSTNEAKTQEKAFYTVNICPFPKKKVKFVVKSLNWEGNRIPIFETTIDPKDYFIRKEAPLKAEYIKISGNKNPNKAVDIAFIAEGYTEKEMDKFIKDVKRVSSYIFEAEPFKSRKKDFNIYAIKSTSTESGTDIPGKNIYKNTATNFTFYTFDVERYLTSFDLKSMADYASNVPYDHIYVLINTDKYGGGGFYNYYTSCSSDNYKTQEVATHELGHGLAGLADEYYNSSVAYNDFYNLKVEPWEPNITTMVNFESKWKNMINKNTKIPTVRTPENKSKVGAFEGGGYLAKGIYSPYQNCNMKSTSTRIFCPVCQKSIEKIINYYCK